MSDLVDIVDKAHVCSTLRLILEGQSGARKSDDHNGDEGGMASVGDERISIETGRAALEEVPRIEACKCLWDWCADTGLATYLYKNHVVDILVLVLGDTSASARYTEVAIGALGALACSIGDEAISLHSAQVQQLMLYTLLPSSDPGVLAETLRFLAAVTASAQHGQAWLQVLWETKYLRALDHLVFILSNTLDDNVRHNVLLLLLNVMFYHSPSLLALAQTEQLAPHLLEMWPELKVLDTERETVLDICELLLKVRPDCPFTSAILNSAEAEDTSEQWD